MVARVKVYSEVLGREIEIPERPERIVSISPALTEILYMLGLEARVVGVSVYDHKPPRAREKPKVGSYFKVNYRALEELKPDLVLITTGAQRRVLEELASRFPAYPVPLPVSVSSIIDQVVQVGILTGEMERASHLESMLLEKASRLRGVARGVRVYYEVFLGGPVTAGAHTYITDAFRLMGIETPFMRERVTWIYNPPPEAINEFRPHFILYEPSAYSQTNEEKARRDLESRGVETGGARIILLEPDSLAHYGPSLVDTLEYLSRKLVRTA